MSKKERIKFFIYIGLILVLVPLAVWKIPAEAEKTSVTISEDEESNEEVFRPEENSTESEEIPEGGTVIKSADLSGNSFLNSTKYDIDVGKLSFSPTETEKNKPLVLIIHTYATQSYSVKNYLTKDSTLKSENEKENVISAGDAFAKALESWGIKVIHDKTLFDKISYSNAYSLSVEKVREYLKEYPSIKYVFDIQRDSLFTQSGNCIKSVANTKNGKSAQILFISGCDENGADFPNWKENLSLSFALSNELESINPKLTRGLNLEPSGYGQYASSGFVTVKIGTAGNTPEEAGIASEFLAEAFCNTVLK